MANKGNQFEWAAMHYGLGPVVGKETALDSKQLTTWNESVRQMQSIPQEIKTAAENVIRDLTPANLSTAQSFHKSFRKLSGGTEPKTDIIFLRNGLKHRCSMKWGNSFQLSSAGIDKSVTFLEQVFRRTALEYGTKADTETLGFLQAVIEQINNKFENNTGTITAAEADRLMSDVTRAGGLNYELQSILGTRKNPQVGGIYEKFKYELTKECLTGEIQFGSGNEKCATHMFTETGVRPIDDTVIRQVMSVAGVRISKKGRGRAAGGLRMNQITIRYEV